MGVSLLYWLMEFTQSYGLTASAVFFSNYLVYVLPVVVLVYVFITEKSWFQKSFYIGASTLIAVCVSEYLLKGVFEIARPFVTLGYTPLVFVDGFSFPSSHGAFAGALIVALSLVKTKHTWFRVGIIVLCVGIALSRIMLGVHYPIDVIMGCVVGCVVSYIGYRLVYTKQ